MAFLVIYKNDEDPIKNEDTTVVITLYIDFSDAQGQLIWPKLKLMQAFVDVRVTCKNLKMKALEWLQHLFHYMPMGICPDAQGQLTPQSLVR